MKKYFQYAVSFILFLTGFIVPGYAQTATIKGKILAGGEALPFATVSLGNKFLLSDQKGEFLISVKPGNYILVITHTGYKTIEQQIKLEAGDSQTINFNMVPVEQMGEVVVVGPVL